MDYKKAFDLVDHHLLISKLKALGIGEDYLPLFTSYLRGRRQYVNINGCHSRAERGNLGVPKGSILGSVLFLIFINDFLLGIKLDGGLFFDEHVDSLCKKLSQRIDVLRKIKSFLTVEQHIIYYNAMIIEPMMYDVTMGSSC